MIYRKYESQDIMAIRDILENDLGYNCELNKLSVRVEQMIKRGNYQIFVACDGDKFKRIPQKRYRYCIIKNSRRMGKRK